MTCRPLEGWSVESTIRRALVHPLGSFLYAGGGSGNLLPCASSDLTRASDSATCRRKLARRASAAGELGNSYEAHDCAAEVQMIEFEPESWRRRPDLNRGWRFCRPLPYLLATAPRKEERRVSRPAYVPRRDELLERETGFEPATSTLARSHSTTELFPPEPSKYHTVGVGFKLRRPAKAPSATATGPPAP